MYQEKNVTKNNRPLTQRQPQQRLNVLINSRILSHPHCIVEKTEPLSRSQFLIMLITHGKATKFASFDRNIHCAHFLMTLFIKNCSNSQSPFKCNRLPQHRTQFTIIIIIISIYSVNGSILGLALNREITLNTLKFHSTNYSVRRVAVWAGVSKQMAL